MNMIHPWRKEYNTNTIAATIARGHASDKHIHKFHNLGIYNEKSLAHHIARTLDDKSTQCFRGKDNCDFFYNKKSNTYIVVDLSNKKDLGTCYRPEANSKKFDDKFKKEIKDCKKYGFKAPKVIKGGYPALKKHHRELKRALIQKKNVSKNDIFKSRNKRPTPPKELKRSKEAQRKILAKAAKIKRDALTKQKAQLAADLKKQTLRSERLAEKIRSKKIEQLKAKELKEFEKQHSKKQAQSEKDQFADLAQKMRIEKAEKQRQIDLDKQKQIEKTKPLAKPEPKPAPAKDTFAELAEKMRLEREERQRRQKEMEMKNNFGKKF